MSDAACSSESRKSSKRFLLSQLSAFVEGLPVLEAAPVLCLPAATDPTNSIIEILPSDSVPAGTSLTVSVTPRVLRVYSHAVCICS